MRKIAIAIAVAIFAAGCWPWHHGKSPQQQYAEALMHGNAMAASQIWLNMSPEDRVKFTRGEGISPDPAEAENAKRQILQHYQSEMEEGEGTAASAPMEQNIPTPLGQALQSLPEVSGSSPPPQGNN